MKTTRLACQKLTDIHGKGHVQIKYSQLATAFYMAKVTNDPK